MSNRFFITILVVLGILGGIFWFSGQKTKAPINNTEPSKHVKGQGTAGVTLVEYGDFQCPVCGTYFPILKAVEAQYADQITFQFRNFPIVQLHPNAMTAHRAAEAAGNQGKFFEMHDLLYSRQQLWTNATSVNKIFEAYAQELGLDINRYQQDVASEATLAVINADVTTGQKLGVTGTPTFFVNDKKIENPRSVEDFAKVIDEAIKAKATGQSQ